MTGDEQGPTSAALSARRLHPASPFIGLIFQLRQLLVPLVLSLFLGRDDGFSGFQLAFFVGLPASIALMQYLAWRRFEYRVVGGDLIVDSGVINRRRREIPVSRIHHIEEDAKLQHRVFGVVKVRIDSGGGESASEIQLDSVSKAEAARLRAVVAGRSDVQTPINPTPAGAEPPLVRLGVGRLVVAGVTNVPLATTVALIGSGIQVAEQSADKLLLAVIDRVPMTVAGIAGALATAAILYISLAGAASVFSNYGYVLEREGGELRVQRGLLDRRRSVVDIEKLTVLRVEETIIRRALGLCALRLQTISGRSGGSLAVPLLDEDEVPQLVQTLMPVASPLPPLQSHPPAARRRIYVRRVFIGLCVAAPIAWFWRPAGVLVAVLLIALAACRAEVAYRALGHGTRDAVLLTRYGGLRRKTAITTWPRAESTRLRSSPLQRWAGLATLYVDVPQGGSVAIPDADPAELNALRKLALAAPASP